MTDIDNNKLMGLLIFAGGGLLLIQEHINEKRKWRQWVHPLIRKSILSDHNDLRLTAKEQIKIMRFHFLYAVQVDIAYQKVHCNSCLFLLLSHGMQKPKEHIMHKGGFIVFYSKNNFCIMNKIRLVWFFDHFIYFKNNFYHVTLVTLFIEYWIILYIFWISLCVTST